MGGDYIFSILVCVPRNIQKDLLWYIPLVSHLVVVAAQAYEVVIVQPSVVVLIYTDYVMHFHRLEVQPLNGVI